MDMARGGASPKLGSNLKKKVFGKSKLEKIIKFEIKF
jgi:hypothetical protein